MKDLTEMIKLSLKDKKNKSRLWEFDKMFKISESEMIKHRFENAEETLYDEDLTKINKISET